MAASTGEGKRDVPAQYHAPSPDPFFTLRPFGGEVSCAQYADIAGKETVITGTSNGIVGLWDLATKKQVWKHQCENGVLSAAKLSSNEVIALTRGGNMAIWDLETEIIESKFAVPDPGFCRFIFLDSNNVVLSDREYGQINIIDVASRGSIVTRMTVSDPKSKGMGMCLARVSSIHFLVGFEDGSIVLTDTRVTDKEVSSLKLYTEPVMGVAYDVTSHHGAAGSPTSTLETFTISSQDSVDKKYSVPLRNEGVADVAVRHDGRIMASGGWDGRIRIFGCKKGKALAVLNYHTASVQSVAFAPAPGNHGNLLMCGSKDQRISLWKLY